MDEKKLKLDIPNLIPGLNNQHDRCLNRLQEALQSQNGIQRVHIKHGRESLAICLHYDAEVLSTEQARGMAEAAGAHLAQRFQHASIPVEDVDCSDCALVIEHSVGRMDGILDASIPYPSQTLHIEFDQNQVNRKAVERRLSHLGYRVPVYGIKNWVSENIELLSSLLAGLLVLVGWLGGRFLGFQPAIRLGLFAGAYLAGGWEASRHAWQSLRRRDLDTHLLMILAAVGAAVLGDFLDGGLLLFLFSLGHALEERAMERARSAIHALANLAPNTATVLRNGESIEIPIERVEIGDEVTVRPGVRLPVDGIVLKGESAVDQSPVTGESMPVDKGAGDKVFAGTVNGEGALEIEVTRLAKDSTLSRVVKMVEAAQEQKSPTQQITEKVMKRFVPVVLGADLLLITLPPLFGVPFGVAFLRAMTLLVAASPCALALGAPSAVLAGIARAARGGVLVKGGAALESLGSARAIAFDKTGTITVGKPVLTDIIVLPDFQYPINSFQQSEKGLSNKLLSVTAAVESQSAHPLAQAVVQAARERGLDIPRAEKVVAETGHGIQADVDHHTVWVGKLAILEETGAGIPSEIISAAVRFQGEGKTIIAVTIDQKPAGLMAVADQIRPETTEAIRKVRQMGIKPAILLTGDNERAAQAIARQAGLDEQHANLLPEGKASAVQGLLEKYSGVIMVGDGVNDAPALANASVGIAMGGAGTDAALETADVALMANDLSHLPFAVGVGRATRAIMTQNLVIALGVIAVLVIATVFGLTSIGLAVFIHEGSTLAVALNSLRLLNFNLKE